MKCPHCGNRLPFHRFWWAARTSRAGMLLNRHGIECLHCRTRCCVVQRGAAVAITLAAVLVLLQIAIWHPAEATPLQRLAVAVPAAVLILFPTVVTRWFARAVPMSATEWAVFPLTNKSFPPVLEDRDGRSKEAGKWPELPQGLRRCEACGSICSDRERRCIRCETNSDRVA